MAAGISYYAVGNFDCAIGAYAKALSCATGEVPEELEDADRRMEMVDDPSVELSNMGEQAAAHTALGTVYDTKGDIGRAEQEHKLAIKLATKSQEAEPDDSDTYESTENSE